MPTFRATVLYRALLRTAGWAPHYPAAPCPLPCALRHHFCCGACRGTPLSVCSLFTLGNSYFTLRLTLPLSSITSISITFRSPDRRPSSQSLGPPHAQLHPRMKAAPH